MPEWKEELLERLGEGPATARQIGELLDCYGPDAVVRAREAGIPLVTIGRTVGVKGKSVVHVYALEGWLIPNNCPVRLPSKARDLVKVI